MMDWRLVLPIDRATSDLAVIDQVQAGADDFGDEAGPG